MSKHIYDWTPEVITKLTALWGEGLTVAQIGRRLKIGKDAVSGKIRRLGLPGRPSPIKPRKPATEKPSPYVMPPLPAYHKPVRAVQEVRRVMEAPVRLETCMAPVSPRGACLWTDGVRGAFVCCTARATRGCFCNDHASVGYVRVLRAEAA